MQDKSLMEQALVASVQITRRSVFPPNQPVLTTGAEVAYFEKGVTTWSLDLGRANPVEPAAIPVPHVAVAAEWLDTQAALERGVKVVCGDSANTFAGMGALLVPDGFRIPTVMASRDNVGYYGLELIETGTTFAVSSPLYQIVMMRYDYTAHYKHEFLMQPAGGGGIFVETHEFPHVHVPMSPECGGYIVIGKRVGPEYHFTAFQIPFGFGLITPSNTIHGDGTLVGEYALTVADSAFVSADTVLIYNDRTLAMARDVVPDWPA